MSDLRKSGQREPPSGRFDLYEEWNGGLDSPNRRSYSHGPGSGVSGPVVERDPQIMQLNAGKYSTAAAARRTVRLGRDRVFWTRPKCPSHQANALPKHPRFAQ